MPATRRLGRSAATAPTVLVASAGALSRARCGAPSVLADGIFSTTFPLTESPMVEDGGWVQPSVAGTHHVDTSGGFAYGPLGGVGGATDAVAHRTGFTANHYVKSIIRKSGSLSDFAEVENLLRVTSSGSAIQYYEVNLAWDGRYCQVVRVHGASGDAELSFDFIVSNFSNQANPADGDEFYAEIVGNIITVKLNGALVGTCDITSIGGAVYNTGNPGIGFFWGEPALSGVSDKRQYSFTSVTMGGL